jgi:hypothetical protein
MRDVAHNRLRPFVQVTCWTVTFCSPISLEGFHLSREGSSKLVEPPLCAVLLRDVLSMGETGEYGRCVLWARACDGRTMARPGNEPAKYRLTAFPYYHGMLLEPVGFFVLLLGTLASTRWGLSCSGSRRPGVRATSIGLPRVLGRY